MELAGTPAVMGWAEEGECVEETDRIIKEEVREWEWVVMVLGNQWEGVPSSQSFHCFWKCHAT